MHYQSVFGFPITEYYERIGIDFRKESMAMLTEKFISSYNKQVLECQLHDNVAKVLSSFEADGKGQYILTAAHKATVLPLLEHYQIADHFIAIEGLDNHRAESKVHRGHALLETNEINKERTVLIGDTNHDFEVAEAMGIDCVLVANGHQSRARLEADSKGKAQVVDHVGELLTSLPLR